MRNKASDLIPVYPNPEEFARVVACAYKRRKMRQIVTALEEILDQRKAQPENRRGVGHATTAAKCSHGNV